MVWIQIRTNVLYVLIWVQTVFKGNQQATKVTASKKRVGGACLKHVTSYRQNQTKNVSGDFDQVKLKLAC